MKAKRKTRDILLKLDCDTLFDVGNNETIEVFISYSKIEDVNRFFFNYGFIPTSNYPEKLFEIPFWGFAEGYVANYDDIKPDGKLTGFNVATLNVMKLFQPTHLQFVVDYDDTGKIDKVNLNLLDNYSFLTLIDKIDVSHMTDNFEPNDIIELVMQESSEIDINKAIYKLLQLIDGYFCKQLCPKLIAFKKEATEKYGKVKSNATSSGLLNYVDFQLELIHKFLESVKESVFESPNKDKGEYEEVFSVIVSPDCCDEEWLNYRF
ncbi:unnamed protein product [Ambrosiozyma monospora]|uniref:Unnamed protein product n=1 Tax=Ambrosiozyma monospora TaxID=43982 RepID=A0ACB5TBC6_AMBMO|nr:unnamed protein product [Ambrosiozyma monospora]